MNSTTKTTTWVEKGPRISPRKKNQKRKELYSVPTTIKQIRRKPENEP